MLIITKFKNSCFYSILVSFLILMLEGLSISIVYELTKSQGLSYILGYIFAIAIIVIIKRKELLLDAKTFKQDIKGKTKNIICFFFIFIFLMYISNGILYSLFKNIASNESDVRTTLFSSPLLIGLSLSIFAPIIEELGFRYPYKKANTNKYLKFAIYTLIFAFIHVVTDLSFPGILFIIPYTFLSLSIGYPYFKTGNIYTSMIAHIFNNTISILLVLLIGG